MDIIKKIETSILTEGEKEAAIYYLNKYKGMSRLGYYDLDNDFFDYGRPFFEVARGTIELILAILNKENVDSIKKLPDQIEKISGHWDSWGEMHSSFYEGLKLASDGVFNVQNFTVMLDGDYDEDYPYAGYIKFDYEGENFYYAPHYDIFHNEILRFINYFLLKNTNTNKRFCITSFGYHLSGCCFGPALFIEQTEREMLERYQWLNDYDINSDNECYFWKEPQIKVEFISLKKNTPDH